MTEQTLARARAGDEDAFRELTDPYRRELQLHVYRIVGSAQDAEDLLQETLLAAWRGLERFEGRASVRAWLYRIATNRSLDALRASRRRPEGPAADDRGARADPPRRADLARALPRRPARGDPRRGSRTGGALRDQRGDRAGVHRRPAASPAAAARGARAARRARLPRRRGRRDARDQRRPRSTACCAARARRSSPACRPPDANARRSRTPGSSATSSAASPTPSRRATSTASSPCSPTTPG